MTTLAYNNKTKELGADTQMTFDDNYGYCNKILFPKKGVVLATAGDAGEGEWLRHWLANIQYDIFDLYKIEDRPKFSKSFSAFIWFAKKPYIIYSDLYPIPVETDYWCGGTGGNYALAYLHINMPMHEAILKASKIDPNSGAPAHVVKLVVPNDKFKIEIYE